MPPTSPDHRCSGPLRLAAVLLLFAVASSLAACGTDTAPKKITNVSKWFWRNYDTATDAEIADAFVQLNGVVTPVTADEPMQVLVPRLDNDDVALVGRTGVDASKAVGMLVVTDIKCTIAQVEKIHTSGEPNAVHPGAYKSYVRTFVQDRDEYLAGKFTRLDWKTELESDYAKEKLDGSIRHVRDLGADASPFGVVLLSRTVLTEPAVGTDWPQDYQIDAYYERKPGRVVHLFAVWRQADFSGLSTENSFLQDIQMDGFVDWDKEIETACASGKF